MVSGQTLHPIFSNNRYVFEVTETFETLYRKRLHQEESSSGDYISVIDDACIYRKAYVGASAQTILHRRKPRKIGLTEPFRGTSYILYEVSVPTLGKDVNGYILVPRNLFTCDEANSMYFVFEKKVR